MMFRVVSFDKSLKEMIRAQILHDSVNKRERLVGESVIGNITEYYDLLYLHNEKIEYKINLMTKVCTKQALSRQWIDFGIPKIIDNSKKIYIGSSSIPDANLLITSWANKITDKNGNEFIFLGTWTYEDCLPVSAVYYSKVSHTNIHYSFYNIIIGILLKSLKS